MDKFYIHRFKVRIHIISMQVQYKRSHKIQLQSEIFLNIGIAILN